MGAGIGAVGARAGRCSLPPHSLHWLPWRSSWQMPAAPHSLHLLLWRWCGQMPARLHSLLKLFSAGAGSGSALPAWSLHRLRLCCTADLLLLRCPLPASLPCPVDAFAAAPGPLRSSRDLPHEPPQTRQAYQHARSGNCHKKASSHICVRVLDLRTSYFSSRVISLLTRHRSSAARRLAASLITGTPSRA